jgi:ABC-type lipoprotein export system ATPase subunit
MISVKNLSFGYHDSKRIRFPDFQVTAGEHYLLLGESGSGKTTLLHLLAGLLRGYEGSLEVNQTELSSLSESALDHFRGRHIGLIFQRNHLISALSVEKNLLMAPFLAGTKADHSRVSHLLRELGLEEKKNSNVKALSQGQAQRVAIARAILNKPSIIFADEPTSALDDKNCDRVIRLLEDVASANKATLVIATHDQRLKNKISRQIQLSAI